MMPRPLDVNDAVRAKVLIERRDRKCHLQKNGIANVIGVSTGSRPGVQIVTIEVPHEHGRNVIGDIVVENGFPLELIELPSD